MKGPTPSLEGYMHQVRLIAESYILQLSDQLSLNQHTRKGIPLQMSIESYRQKTEAVNPKHIDIQIIKYVYPQ